jgi:hypothetical protein
MAAYIGEIHSTVRTTDSASLLSPETLECIVRAVMERLHEEEQHRGRVESERRLISGIVSEEQ